VRSGLRKLSRRAHLGAKAAQLRRAA
jgi:hypothetical protein